MCSRMIHEEDAHRRLITNIKSNRTVRRIAQQAMAASLVGHTITKVSIYPLPIHTYMHTCMYRSSQE
jgi:hypothetical protein